MSNLTQDKTLTQGQIIVDYRESALIKCLEALKQPFKTENLLIGDIVITNDTFKIIIERKTFQDLSSSIVDNRFREQRARLEEYKSSTKEASRIMYIFEGPKNTRGVSQAVINGAILGLVLRTQFGIFYTKDTKHTAEICYIILKKLVKGDFYTTKVVAPLLVKQKAKKDVISDNILAIQLSAINGVSYTTALRIQEKYPTMKSLIDAFNDNGELVLNDIKLTSINGSSTRKLGKVLSKRIHDSLFTSQKED